MSVKIYRKKPVEIAAVQYTGDNPDELQAFCEGQIQPTDDGPVISTLEGVMRVSLGDFVIRGVKGEMYPCKPDIFEASYDWTGDIVRQIPDEDGGM